MKKVKYMVVVNLGGVTGPLRLYRKESGWWDDSGDFGWIDGKPLRDDLDCYQFVTGRKELADAFKLGTDILAKRLMNYLGSRN